MEAHIAEHVAFLYRMKIEEQLGVPLPPVDEPLPVDVENEIARPPRAWAEKIYNIEQWNQYPGGHFAALENSEILASDIFSFAKKLKIL